METMVGSSEKTSAGGSSRGGLVCRRPLQEFLASRFRHHQAFPRQSSSRQSGGDRFIPCRSALDFDFAHAMLTETRKEKENAALASPSREAYRKHLAETLLQNRTRILAFKAKPPEAIDAFQEVRTNHSSSHQVKSAKQRRYIPQSAERTLDAPDLVDDYYLNLLDWGSSNVLAITLGNSVYLWDAADGSMSELTTVDEDSGPVTSVSWAPEGQHIALGLNISDPAVEHKLQSIAEDSDGSSPISGGSSFLEQPPSDDWGDGWHGCKQRCEGVVTCCLHLQRPPSRSLRAEMVGL